MKAFAVLLSGIVLFVLAAFSAEAAAPEAAKRVALVIGNSKYVNAVPLPNPANDAQLIASTLRNAGFDVIEGVDQDNQGMHSLISRFTEESYNADLAVIFYAGHGMQVDGKNYLIPVDAELTSPAYLKTRTVQIDEFMAALPPDPAVGVIILDACRDNPLARTLAASLPKSRSLGAGLAPVEAKADGVGTGGVLIAYATDPGAIAFDGNGVDSPYSLALAKHLTEPGIEIQSALTRVRGEVTEATQGRQRPWHNASLGREVFLGKLPTEPAPATAPEADASKTTAAPATSAPVAGEPPSWEVEQRLWDEASKKNAIPFYEAYLDQFPNGRFATVAKLNIDQLKDPKAGKQVAALDANGADANAGSAVRTSVGITDAMKQTPGTEQTEGAIGLDRDGRIDLQLRIEALGNELGQVDGNIGPRTRQAIGVWQGKNGLPQTTYLTGEQLAFLVIQTDPMMDAVRAKNAAEQARAATPKKPVVQKTRTLKPVAQKPRRKQQQVVQRRRNSETVVREEGPPPNDNNDFLTKALIFGTGVAVGGVLNKN